MERSIEPKLKKKKVKNSKAKIILLIILIVVIVWAIVNKYAYILNDFVNNQYFINQAQKPINVEELSKNSLYEGIGQEKIEGKDGYDTTFTTIDGKIYKEYKQTGNASYKNNSYWGGTFEENGCGLASIATLLSGYELKYTPEDLRKIYVKFDGEHLEGNQMYDELTNRFNISNTDFLYSEVYFKKDYIIKHLKQNKPILICVWNKPDSKWTTTSHYMLLLATDGKDKVYVSNPNGLYGKEKMSGWYNTNEILPYIAKAMFINE